MIDTFFMYHRPSVSRLNKLEEDSTLAQELNMDPVALVHTNTAGMEVAKDVGVGSFGPGPHSRITRGLIGTVARV